jgi:hypothetical protein
MRHLYPRLALASLLSVSLLGAAPAASAERRPPERGKLSAGAAPVETNKRALTLRRLAASPLRLALHAPGAKDAAAGPLTAEPGSQLVLALDISNDGDGRFIELRGTTLAMDVLLPDVVEVAPRTTTTVEVRVVKQDCQPRASFLLIAARPRGATGVRPASVRVGVRCRAAR